MNRCLASSVVAIALVACGDNTDNTAELEEQIDDLQAQIADITAQLAQAHEDLTTRTQERDALSQKLGALEGKTTPTVTLEVPLMYGSQALQLGTAYPFGTSDTISFREVRYWLTNVALQKPNGDWVAIVDAYYLVEARGEQALTNGTSAAVMLPALRREAMTLRGLPSGDYKAIKFSIGVDQAHNDDLSNAAGELHTLKNMTFDNGWMWFTSYVFTKTVADLNGGDPDTAEVSWDNGTNADLREVTLAFPSQISMGPGAAFSIKLKADVAELVADVNPRTRGVIDAETPEDRTVLANGFRDMFTMVSVDPVP